jgi:hypothetical protein
MGTLEEDIEEIQLKLQALADNELAEDEIGPVLTAVQGSYEYREEYAELLRLKKRLSGVVGRGPGNDWVLAAERSITRKLFRGLGTVFFIGTYLALLGVAALTFFRDSDVPTYVSVLVGVGIAGLVVLLGTAIADRVRESRTDKYRGVIR